MKLKNMKTFKQHSSELNISDVSESIYITISDNKEKDLVDIVKVDITKRGYFDFSENKQFSKCCDNIYKYLSKKPSKDSWLYDVIESSDFEQDTIKSLKRKIKKYQSDSFYEPILEDLETIILMLDNQ